MPQEKEKSVGAFWEKEGREGSQYFSGEVEGKRYIMFVNKYHRKGEDQQPTFKLYPAKENPNYQKRITQPNPNDAPVFPGEDREIETKDIPF